MSCAVVLVVGVVAVLGVRSRQCRRPNSTSFPREPGRLADFYLDHLRIAHRGRTPHVGRHHRCLPAAAQIFGFRCTPATSPRSASRLPSPCTAPFGFLLQKELEKRTSRGYRRNGKVPLRIRQELRAPGPAHAERVHRRACRRPRVPQVSRRPLCLPRSGLSPLLVYFRVVAYPVLCTSLVPAPGATAPRAL